MYFSYSNFCNYNVAWLGTEKNPVVLLYKVHNTTRREFILKVSTLSRVSFLLFFIIICNYILSLVLARETYILYNMYIKISLYILT